MKIVMHVHTKYSKDSLLCFWPLYLKCLWLQIEYIAITEHNNIDGGVNFQRFCQKRGNRVHVIVGEEVFTSEGEIIGLYLKESIPPELSPQETIKLIHRQGGIVCVPHPYDIKRWKTVLKEIEISANREMIDCIEIHNGRNSLAEFAVKQKEIADKYKINPVIGSDAHTWIEIGRNYMTCPDRDLSSSDAFMEEIKNFILYPGSCIKISHLITKMAKLVKIIKRGNFSELYGIVIKKVKS